MTEKTLSVVEIISEWPKMYCTKTDKFRLVTQKDVDDMQQVVGLYGRMAEIVKDHARNVKIERYESVDQ